jgi:tetratricopeptide (TPR) repeat protein
MEHAFDIRIQLRSVLINLGEFRQVPEWMRQAETLAERLNDDRRRGLVCAHLIHSHMRLGELDEARMCGTRALASAQALGDLDLQILATCYLEEVHYFLAEYERVVELAKGNLAALPANRIYDNFGWGGAPASVYSRHYLIISLCALGRFSEAAEYQAESIRIAEAKPTRNGGLGFALHSAVGLHAWRGDWTKAHVASERAIAVLRKGNFVYFLAVAVAQSARILAQLGETSAALSRLQEGEQLLEQLRERLAAGVPGSFAFSYCHLGQAALLLSRLDEARKLTNRVVESFVRDPGATVETLQLLGAIASHPDRFDAEGAEANYRKALALAQPRGMRPRIAHCHLGLGKLYWRTSKREQAQEHLTTATAMYREMGMTYWLEQAEAERAKT